MFRLAPTFVLTAALAAQGTGLQLQNGVDAHFDVPASPLLVPSAGITIEAWLTYDDSTVPSGTYRWPTVCRENVSPGQESYFLRVAASNNNSKSLQFKVNTASGGRSITWTFAAGQLATWTHVACTWDGTTQNIYVNGQVVSTASLGGGRILNNGGILRVGNGDVSSPGAETWNGQIDELRIWPFARSQAEIQDSMGDALSALPGGVITFGLDNSYTDSSSGLTGTTFGPIGFASNTNALTPRPAVTFPLGPGTSNCAAAPVCAIAAPPVVGRAGFAWVATGGPVNSAGLLAFAAGGSAGLNILGINLFVDTATLLPIAVNTNALGTCRVALGVPNRPGLVGAGLASQFVFVDAGCGPQGLVASNALLTAIQ
ncbi:MAG: LamG domain-containing protein [Planctomycetota bacterium]